MRMISSLQTFFSLKVPDKYFFVKNLAAEAAEHAERKTGKLE